MSYSNPVLFDDILTFAGSYMLQEARVTIENLYRQTGGLNYWTAGFGLQVAPKLGIGMSAALVTGREITEYQFDSIAVRNSVTDAIQDKMKIGSRYFGYDLRAGIAYQTGFASLRARLEAPRVIRLSEQFDGGSRV